MPDNFASLPARKRMVAAPAVAGHQPLAIALAIAACFAANTVALAQPTGAQAIYGSATLSQSGSRLTVTTQNGAGANYSAINWQSFGIPAGSSTWFAQPASSSTSINRVTGPDPSAIFGSLGSNGRLVLVNPAGITVGVGAVVDSAGFTASTLRMSDADALAGRMRFGDGTSAADLNVAGRILARSGDVVLLAPNVTTAASALISSPSGAVVLAAGQQAEITGRGLEGIHLALQAPADQALNLGTLNGDAVGIFARTLKHSGSIDATAVTVQGGRVLLQAAGGDALVSGSVRAAGQDSVGGRIDVFGQRVGLLAGAALDASGELGGGSIRIGGDFQGKNGQAQGRRHGGR
jgi:filamentous hemagglutinin family protein